MSTTVTHSRIQYKPSYTSAVLYLQNNISCKGSSGLNHPAFHIITATPVMMMIMIMITIVMMIQIDKSRYKCDEIKWNWKKYKIIGSDACDDNKDGDSFFLIYLPGLLLSLVIDLKTYMSSYITWWWRHWRKPHFHMQSSTSLSMKYSS